MCKKCTNKHKKNNLNIALTVLAYWNDFALNNSSEAELIKVQNWSKWDKATQSFYPIT